jgi:hypothetical protein
MRTVLALVVLATATASAAPAKKAPPKKDTPAATAPTPPPAPPPEPVGPPKPWAEGVPKEQQDKATALYEEGNTFFAQQQHAPALEKYKEAIALWDHPLIRFNMAVTEVRLERILEAADDLEKALKYGDDPFKQKSDTLYQQALDYQALVKGRVGYIEASSDQAGAHIFLDGKPWFDAPGKKSMRVLAGEHAISGEKDRFLTSTKKVVVSGDKTTSEVVKLLPLDAAVVLKYPYRRWIPWSTLVLGVAVGVGGVGTWFLGKNQMTQFNNDYAAQCANGCEPGLTDPAHRALSDERDAAELKGKIGIAMGAAGGAVAITGIVLAILNRPTRVLPNVEVGPNPGLAGGAHASVGWRF